MPYKESTRASNDDLRAFLQSHRLHVARATYGGRSCVVYTADGRAVTGAKTTAYAAVCEAYRYAVARAIEAWVAGRWSYAEPQRRRWV